MSIYTLWTHGHSIVLQDKSWTLEHVAQYAEVTASPSSLENWVHFPIPTLTMEGGIKTGVDKVFIRLATGVGVHIVDVVLYNGEGAIKSLGPLSTSPLYVTYSLPLPLFNETAGLGLSVLVSFVASGSNNQVRFVGAGAQFVLI